VFLMSCFAGAAALSAADWPQWRGLNRDGTSAESIAWPAAGPKEIWRAAVGVGFSSIAISKGKVYTLGNSSEQDTIWCFDARNGALIWKHSYAAQPGPVFYEGGPGSTPTVHEDRVYTIGKWGDVFCLDAGKGDVLWHQALGKEGIKSNRWGFAGSPLVWQDLVILNAAAAGTALDRKSGKLVWFNGTQPTGYASPALFDVDGEQRVLIFAAKHLVAVDPKTGTEQWRFPWETGYDTNNSDPLIQRNKIFISSYSRGCALLEAKGGGAEAIYESKVLHNHLSPGILLGEYLYAFNGEALHATDLRYTRPICDAFICRQES
jgi:outer membrane protein assembly factor BamB